MTALFTRYGTEMAATHRSEKGKPIAIVPRKCGRCGGAGGHEMWRHTGWTCYDCGGTGKHKNGPERVKLYTGEELAKLNAAAEKRAAKKAAKVAAEVAAAKAEAEARRAEFMAAHGALLEKAEPYKGKSEFVASVLAKATERCEISEKAAAALAAAVERIAAEEARKAAAGYIGKVGERVKNIKVTVTHVAEFPSAYGYNRVFRIVGLRTAEGNTVVVKSGSFYTEKGETLTISGTVKEHSEYKGEKQTRLERVAIEEVAAEEAAA